MSVSCPPISVLHIGLDDAGDGTGGVEYDLTGMNRYLKISHHRGQWILEYESSWIQPPIIPMTRF
jgi:hypothetical protein